MASLLLGNPAAADGLVPTKLFQYLNYASGFVQDGIRLNSKFTLNVGMRWERETGLIETNDNLIVGFDRKILNSISASSGVPAPGAVQFAGQGGNKRSTGNPDQNKLSPRIGVAYQMNSKTTIRGGYGIFWAPAFAYGGPLTSEGFIASTQAVTTVDSGRTPAVSLSNVFASGLDSARIAGLLLNFRRMRAGSERAGPVIE